MQEMITLTIDGVKVTVPKGSTVLEAARAAKIRIPTLCYMKDLNEIGACRLCVVDTGARSLQASCVLPATDGMVVKTNTPAVREARKANLEMLLSNHNRECTTCVRNGTCELQALTDELGVRDVRFEGKRNEYTVDQSSPSIERDPSKCILCRRCVAVCRKVQNVGVLGATNRGFDTIISPAFGNPIANVPCINCGQCVVNCPTGALREKDDTQKVWDALNDPELHVVVQPAPAVRVGIGEAFGMPMGSRVTGKLSNALHRLGFDKVFDTDFGADLTIMEEANELIERIQNGGKLPMFTSCSPGWIKFCETYHPEMLENLSSCKSPHEMVGAMIKTYYAEKNGIDPKKIVVVSVMPCTAKKFEAKRPELGHDGLADVDIVITTRELARMIKAARIDFAELDDQPFDDFFGDSTGAGVIFGATGGVMEAALRTAYKMITGKELENLDIIPVRGIEGVKEATVDVNGLEVKVAVASSTGAASQLIRDIQEGKRSYHFVEVMACPGGCVNGGGQPIVSAEMREKRDPRLIRGEAVYAEDREMPLRRSHENPSIIRLYEEYLGKPGAEKAHHLLHTHYAPRKKYI
nr:NADH-dependent [FeFe] hydrogenase, group A6 [bacterium]